MLVSELIKLLEQFNQLYGDCKVVFENESMIDEEIHGVELNSGGDKDSFPECCIW